MSPPPAPTAASPARAILAVAGVVVVIVGLVVTLFPSLWTQFVDSSFGSDELNHYTANYTWSANQMAHAMMGAFIGTVWASFVAQRNWRWGWLLLPFGFLVLKEVTDWAYDLYRFRASTFTVPYWNMLYDSLTDLFFWWFGMGLTATFVYAMFARSRKKRWGATVGVGVIGAAVTFFLGPVWLTQKTTFDKSNLPFNYKRLIHDDYRSSDPAAGPFAELNPENLGYAANDPEAPAVFPAVGLIQKFQEGAVLSKKERVAKGLYKHYVLIGGRPAARTQLAVSLGCEYTSRLWFRPDPDTRAEEADAAERDELIALGSVRAFFTSAVKLMEDPSALEKNMRIDRIECVIVDDVNTHLPQPEDVRDHYKRRRARDFRQTIRKAPVASAVGGVLLGAADAGNDPERQPVYVQQSRQQLMEQSKNPNVSQPQREQLVDKARKTVFRDLGAVAHKHKVVTAWVLSGNETDKRRLWVEAIAYYLGLPSPSELCVIKLADPPAQR